MAIRVKELCLVNRFSGICINQTRDYVKLYKKTCLDKILCNTLGCMMNTKLYPHTYPIPMRDDSIYQCALGNTPPCEDMKSLERKIGSGYRPAIDELIYVFRTC